MNTYIRTHVKNDTRFKILRQTVESCFDKRINELGDIYIVNDSSPAPYDEKVRELAYELKTGYIRSFTPPDTKNGLFESLSHFYQNTSDPFCLCCVDDMVFGKGSLDRIREICDKDIPRLGNNWATIGMFACYETRPRYLTTSLWNISTSILYALVCHMFNREFIPHLYNPYIKFLNGEHRTETEIYNMTACDDIWVARTAGSNGFLCFNTAESDYAQHTGVNQRTFSSNNTGSEYTSKVFVGE